MNPQLQYYLGLLGWTPALPILAWQGRQVRRQVPRLPEAERNRLGQVGEGDRPFRLITLGESTVAGVGVKNHREGFSGQIARALHEQLARPVEWQVIARSGYTARQATDQLAPRVPNSTSVDLLVIGLGGNDTFDLTTPARWRADMEALLRSIRERQPLCPVIIANLPPVGAFPAFPPLMQRFLSRQSRLLRLALGGLEADFPGAHFIDEVIRLDRWITQMPDKTIYDFFSDGVHPSSLTYQLWGEEIAGFALDVIRKQMGQEL